MVMSGVECNFTWVTMSRLMKEYRAIRAQREVALRPSGGESGAGADGDGEDSLRAWTATLEGPADSPYAGASFALDLEVPATYPLAPPVARFRPRAMPHVNVNYETGEICLDILKGEWSPVYNLLYVVQAVQRLLREPNPDSPLNLELGVIMREGDLTAYRGLIRYYIQQH